MRTEITRDMTSGNPLQNILTFAVPVIFTNILQQIYILSDMAIIARGVGITGVAALGSVNWLNWLMTGSVIALTQGYTVVVAQRYGEKNIRELRKAIAAIVWCSLLGTVLITLGMLGILRPVLRLLHVSQELFPLAYGYSTIIYMGTIVTMLYNVQASILRALGDSKTPLLAILLSSIINIVLDLLFVFGMNFGVKGAAVATVIAQGSSSVLCFLALIRLKFIVPYKEDWNLEGKIVRKILGLSCPIMFENIVVSTGGVLVQSIVNLYGTNFIAGFTTVNRLYDTLNIIAISLGYAVATFVGQNYGAGYYDRIRKSVRLTLVVSIVSAILIGFGLYIFDEKIIYLFISTTEKSIIEGAVFYLHRFANFLWILYLSTIFRYALQGIGRTQAILLSGITGFFTRSGIAMILPEILGKEILYFDEVAAWLLEASVLSGAYLLWVKKFKKEKRGHVNEL